MSYTPINWQTGDVITAEKLNKMDNGWGVENTQLFSETVTTTAGFLGNEATLTYSTAIDAPTLTVTFDGTDYTCERTAGMAEGAYSYGATLPTMPGETIDFSEYPFVIVSDSGTNTLITESTGTYTVAVIAPTVETSANFASAVKSVAGNAPMLCVSGATTYSEMSTAISAGRLLFFQTSNLDGTSSYIITALGTWTPMDGASVTCIPELTGVSVGTDGIFVATS